MADVNKEIALKVTTDVGQTNTALKSAEERLNEAKKAMIEMAMAGKQGSAEFRALAVEAGTLKGKLELVEQTVDGIGKSTNQIEVFSGAMQGLSAGFAIAQGTAALFAEGNEELQEALVKVQASMALLQGTEQAVQLLRKESAAGQAILIGLQKGYAIAVNIATAATRSFTAALASTGIGALVVGLGILIAKLLETEGATKKTTAEMERATEVQKLLGQQIDLTNEKRQAEINLMEATGATAQQVAAARLKIIGEQLAALDESIAKEKENIQALAGFEDSVLFQKRKTILADKELRQANLQADLLKQLDIIKAADEEEAKINGEKTQLQIDNSLKARQQIITDLEVEMNYRKEVGQSTLELEEKLLREKLSYAELTKTGVMQAQAELRLFLTRDSREEEARIKKEKDDKIQAAREAKAELDKINNDNRRSKLTDYEREREDFVAQRAHMLELMRTSGATDMELQLFAQNSARLAQQMDSEREIAILSETEEKKRKQRQENINQAAQMTMDSLSALTALYTASLGQSEKDQKRAFEANKKFSMAQAIISTLLAVNNALTAGGNPIKLATGAQFVEAGIALTVGMANVIKIGKTQFKSTSAPGGSSISAPASGAGGGQPQIPAAFNPNSTATNPTGQPNPMGAGQQPLRAYVVDRDIENASSRRNMLRDFAAI
jgi:hypothetical protein